MTIRRAEPSVYLTGVHRTARAGAARPGDGTDE